MMKRAAGAPFISFSGREAGKRWTVGGTLREVMMSRGRPAAARKGHLRRRRRAGWRAGAGGIIVTSTEDGARGREREREELSGERRSSPSSGHQLNEGSLGSEGSGQLNDCSRPEQHRRRDGNRIDGKVE